MTMAPEIAAALAILASLFAAVRIGWRFVRRQILRSHWLALAKHALEDIESIKKELQPNGGASLRDRVDDIAEKVSRHEAYNQLLVGGFTRPILVWDAGGYCTQANRAYHELTGFDLGDVQGMNWINVIHPSDREQVLSEWRHTIRDKRFFSMEFRHRVRGGNPVRVLLEARPIIEKAGGVVMGWFGTIEADDEDVAA